VVVAAAEEEALYLFSFATLGLDGESCFLDRDRDEGAGMLLLLWGGGGLSPIGAGPPADNAAIFSRHMRTSGSSNPLEDRGADSRAWMCCILSPTLAMAWDASAATEAIADIADSLARCSSRKAIGSSSMVVGWGGVGGRGGGEGEGGDFRRWGRS
jgi:hypothetical protein